MEWRRAVDRGWYDRGGGTDYLPAGEYEQFNSAKCIKLFKGGSIPPLNQSLVMSIVTYYCTQLLMNMCYSSLSITSVKPCALTLLPKVLNPLC